MREIHRKIACLTYVKMKRHPEREVLHRIVPRRRPATVVVVPVAVAFQQPVWPCMLHQRLASTSAEHLARHIKIVVTAARKMSSSK